MRIKVISIGKTDEKALELLIEKYLKRIKHYIKLNFEIIPDIKNRKNLSESQQKELEGKSILHRIENPDFVILLDEKGKTYTSMEFSNFFENRMLSGNKQLVFVIGGPYGFSNDIYQRANQKLSLSKMTFSHQMIRLFFIEQIYRAFTIIKNKPYHHQ